MCNELLKIKQSLMSNIPITNAIYITDLKIMTDTHVTN